MKTLHLFLNIIFLFFFGAFSVSAQGNVVVASNNPDISYEVIGVEKADAKPYVLTVDPMVNTKYVITRLEEDVTRKGINLFPNPVTDILHLNLQRAQNIEISLMHYELLTLEGNAVMTNNISDVVENIDVSKIKKDTYHLKVYLEKELVKSYAVNIQ